MGLEDDRVLQFLPWARQFAMLCSAKLPVHLSRDDLQAAGILGYLRAAARFRTNGGASFRSYCSARIRGAVLDEVRHWEWAPRSAHRAHRRITRVSQELHENLEREPTAQEVAAALGMAGDKFSTFRAHAQPRQMIPLDEMCENQKGEENLSLAERLADPDMALPDACVRAREDRRRLAACISLLPKSEATVLVLHYLQDVPLQKVAQVLAVTPPRASQLHRCGLARLRKAWVAGSTQA